MRASGQANEAEVPFGIEEIFFSRTDVRGVIQAGNAVFQRVSGFSWDALINAPHKLVRHGQMPSALFHLMWERIKAGQPTGAYICNSSADGRHYWVFAVVLPLADGFLSVSVKPTTPLLDKVKGIYEGLRQAEAAGRSAQDSAEDLVAELSRAGFPRYDSFQARALATEVLQRLGQMGRRAGTRTDSLLAAEAADGIAIELGGMQAMFTEALRIALNLRIAASQLGELGRPVSAISDNYALLANDMVSWLNTRALNENEGFGSIARLVSENLFLRNARDLLSEMSDTFAREAKSDRVDAEGEKTRLVALVSQYALKAQDCQERAMQEAATVTGHLAEMRNHVTALNSIRMLCRIEGATLRHTGVSLDEIGRRLLRITTLGQKVHWATSTS